MTTETKRDLAADLARCEVATEGSWYAGLTEVFVSDGVRTGKTIATANEISNAVFIAEAREGWPHAIRRAMIAEEKWTRLRAIVYTNATGGQGEDINEYDIISNIMDDIASEVPANDAS
ncbi:hypothetical protein [Paenibacillus chibensis]|uniref:hypothetical protein n=1 Tax=Paenibacillus chibensis TaxID=59846 RepID=UPI000FDCCA1F|nr:hypothetical protein [Paenibacillus chibensis]MEC0369997.1 hypothetical protein [Paenibacillus chibensis]